MDGQTWPAHKLFFACATMRSTPSKALEEIEEKMRNRGKRKKRKEKRRKWAVKEKVEKCKTPLLRRAVLCLKNTYLRSDSNPSRKPHVRRVIVVFLNRSC
jgi:hypothetical protein